MKGWMKRDPLNDNYVLVLANAVNFIGIAAWFFFFSTIVFAFYPSMLDTDVAEVVLGLVGSLAALAIFYLIIKPYVTLLAYNQPFDSREIYFYLEGTLPFFPKHSWYYRFIPYYRLNAKRVNRIVNDLQLPRPIKGTETDYSKTSIQAKVSWYIWFMVLFNLIFIVFFSFLWSAMEVSEGGQTLLVAIAVFFLMVMVKRLFESVKSLKSLKIDREGLTVSKAFVSWEDIDSIGFDWHKKRSVKLIVNLKSGGNVLFDIGNRNHNWQHIYNYILHFYQQNTAKVAS